MSNELKVSFYLKRESRLEKSSVGEKHCLPDNWENHYRQQYRPVQYQTENRRTLMARQVRTGKRKKPYGCQTQP